MFLLVVWLAATVNFFLPRFGGGDPVRQKIMQNAASGGGVQGGMDAMVAEYNHKFGLDTPMWKQYLNYLWALLHFDFNYSIINYPTRVIDIIGHALPWTMGLLITTTFLSWIIGSILGAFMGWPRSPKFLEFVMPPLLSLNAIPFFLLGLILLYLFAFRFPWFPTTGGFYAGTFPDWSFDFAWNVLKHSILPALSIILVSIGGWALTMRSVIITTTGEDYVTFADAKGLKNRTIFMRYSVRNALLPQATALALVLGQIIAGTVLVEVIFSYPGIGSTLFNAIRGSDYTLIQGIVFFLILSIALATLILDLIYPLIDPRITYTKA
ncbi:MAG TPA: ABC transporter permease [Thermomicrobiales bacterium]|nr:ABC transporter permease [Thermomicrobiales bacterium]